MGTAHRVCDVPCTDDHCLRSPGTRRPEAPRPLHGGLATPGFPYGFAPPLGLASRTDEMLLFFRPCFVASAYVGLLPRACEILR
jgi:hypothetical protein